MKRFKEFLEENTWWRSAIFDAYRRCNKDKKRFIEYIMDDTGLTKKGVENNTHVQTALKTLVFN